jgi:tRNA threonylcarbamoyladenosine biosynthesis protein TsaB
MTKILALDASSEACSAALRIDQVLLERSEVMPRKHTELILPMVDELLAEAGITLKQLDALAFNRGPGSFTGVRVSTSVVQGLAYALDLPVVPVSGLAALAQGAWRHSGAENILSILDARMHEVYWAYFQYQQGHMMAVGDEHVSTISNLLKPGQGKWLAAGSGVKVYNKEILEWASDYEVKLTTEIAFPQARDVAELALTEFASGNLVNAMEAQPTYIRDKVV